MGFIDLNRGIRIEQYPRGDVAASTSDCAGAASSSSSDVASSESTSNTLETRNPIMVGLHAQENARKVHMAALELDEAELSAYGNKHKNLIKLHRLIRTLQLEGISVPKPRGVRHGQILSFFNTLFPIGRNPWREIQRAYRNYDGDLPFLQRPDVLEKLALIRKTIEAVCAQEHIMNTFELSKEFESWLADMERVGDYLMVRSSGVEDSQKVVNAGGNLSVSYVLPKKSDILQALGKVVGSYFSPLSLQNRIDSGDNPFEEELNLAVTVQQLIGEKIGGESDAEFIPKSVVLFTNEPIYIGNERFRVMRLSCTYGHGEAVVGNHGISTDTIHILQSEHYPNKIYVIYDNQIKKTRLAPLYDPQSEKIELKQIDNPEELIRKRLFDDEMIRRLFELGMAVESYYQAPMDMELVVKGNRIYPVQARPIVRSESLPSYFNLKKAQESGLAPVEEGLRMAIVVSGRSSAFTIESSTEVLIAGSLTEVQEKMLFRKGVHKLVIVANEEPANSHPVINFSLYGIPCLCGGKQIEQARKIVSKIDGQRQLAVCTQSGAIHLWNKETACPQEYIEQGYVVHPAQISHSLEGTEVLPRVRRNDSESIQDIKNLMMQLQAAITSEAALGSLKAIKKHPMMNGLAQLHEVFDQKLEKYPYAAHVIRPVQKTLEELNKLVKSSIAYHKTVLRQNDESRLERLFSFKVLESLVLGSAKKGIGKYSVVSVGSLLDAVDVQISYLQKLPKLGPLYKRPPSVEDLGELSLIDYLCRFPPRAHFVQELFYGFKSPIPGIFSKWFNLLLIVEKKNIEAETVKEFFRCLKEMLCFVDEMKAMPWFMTIEFPLTANSIFNFDNLYKGGSGMGIHSTYLPGLERRTIETQTLFEISLLPNLIKKGDIPLVNQIRQRKQSLEVLKREIECVANPMTFRSYFESLVQEVNAFFPKEDGNLLQTSLLEENWSSVPSLVREMALQIMIELVDLYDKAIKTMKASLLISDEVEKTKTFKMMLVPFLQLAENIAKGMSYKPELASGALWSINLYFDDIRRSFYRMDENASINLRPSDGFSSFAGTLGSGANYVRHLPKTLEDAFTLCHQNLLTIIAFLSNQLLSHRDLLRIPFPDLFRYAIDHVPLAGREGLGKPQRTGLEVRKNSILIHYNLPLRNHSAGMALEYQSQKNDAVKIYGKFYGDARERWNAVRQILSLIGEVLAIPLTITAINENELSYYFLAENENTILAVYELFQKCALFSLDSLNYFTFFDNCLAIIERFMPLHQLETVFNQSYGEDQSVLKSFALRIYDKLIKAGQVNDFADELIVKGLMDSHSLVSTSACNILSELIKQKQKCELVTEAITPALLSADTSLRNNGLKFFEQLLNVGQGIEAAANAAARAIENNDRYVRLSGLTLFNLLFKQGRAYEVATEAAIRVSQNRKKSIRSYAFKVFESLLKWQKGCEAAFELARETLYEENSSNKEQVYSLIAALVGCGWAYDLAIDAVNLGRIDSNPSIICEAIDILTKLVGKGREYDLAANMIARTWQVDDRQIKMRIFFLLEALIEKGQKLDLCVEAALMRFNDNDEYIGMKVLDLFSKLVEKSQYHELCLTVIIQSISFSIINMIDSAFHILGKLLERDYEPAKLAAYRMLNDRRHSARILNLCVELINKKCGYDFALDIAHRVLENENFDARANAYGLLLALIRQGYGCETGILEASKAIRSDYLNVFLGGFKLFCALLEHNKAISEAIEAVVITERSRIADCRNMGKILKDILVSKGVTEDQFRAINLEPSV